MTMPERFARSRTDSLFHPIRSKTFTISSCCCGSGAGSAAITACVAGALLTLDRKIAERRLHRDSDWPLRLAELHRELSRKDASLNDVLLAHRDFGRPDHALSARCRLRPPPRGSATAGPLRKR